MGKYRSLGTGFDKTFRNDLNANFDDIDKDIKSVDTKTNKATTTANEALSKANTADTKAVDAKKHAERLETELGQAILEGDSSPLGGQLSVGADGTVYSGGPQERLVKEHQQVTSLLAKSENKLNSLENANAKSKITIMNYLGNDENIHPKVLHFPNRWNGYTYWMAYTPYPNGDISAENPCIAVSNDMVNWTIPNGLTNPIEPKPDSGQGHSEYNSDTHLVYRQDTNTLELWWRYANNTTNEFIIYRKKSTDGVSWSAKESLWNSVETNLDIVSPAVIYEDGKYKMWGVGRNGSFTYRLTYTESIDGINWSSPVACNIDWGGLRAWHNDVIKTDLGYEHIITAYEIGKSNNDADLYYVFSPDNVNFEKPVKILEKSNNPTGFDNRGIYRASVLKIGEVYSVFYSALNRSGSRALSLSFGKSITGLNGYSKENGVNLGHSAELTNAYLRLFDPRIGLNQEPFEVALRFKDKDTVILQKDVFTENLKNFILNDLIANKVRIKGQGMGDVDLVPDGEYAYTVKFAYPLDNDKNVALKAGLLYLADSTTTSGISQNKEGAIRYNGTKKRHEGYDGSSWSEFNRFVNTVPATYDSPGKKGDYAVKYGYLYVCYLDNTWGRIPMEVGWS